MADSTIKILAIVFFLGLISQGYGQCSLENISVRQAQTGAKVLGKPEWVVTITNNCPCLPSTKKNNCPCVLKNVKLDCPQFQSTEQIDPSVLKIDGDVCLVNNGDPISKIGISFKYAWDKSFPLNPISTDIMCA